MLNVRWAAPSHQPIADPLVAASRSPASAQERRDTGMTKIEAEALGLRFAGDTAVVAQLRPTKP